jgi:hypothetical protein
MDPSDIVLIPNVIKINLFQSYGKDNLEKCNLVHIND